VNELASMELSIQEGVEVASPSGEIPSLDDVGGSILASTTARAGA
jgi:hypothetical protein